MMKYFGAILERAKSAQIKIKISDRVKGDFIILRALFKIKTLRLLCCTVFLVFPATPQLPVIHYF